MYIVTVNRVCGGTFFNKTAHLAYELPLCVVLKPHAANGCMSTHIQVRGNPLIRGTYGG